MTDAVRLYVITDNPDRAARYLMGCSPSALPVWARMVSDVSQIEALPSGVAAIGVFFPAEMRKPSLPEVFWRERVMRGGIDNDRGKHIAKLDDWLDRRAAAESQLISEYIAAQRPDTKEASCA